MDLDNYDVTTFAASRLRAFEPSDEEVAEVKASITNLKSLLPPDINPEDEPALLFVAGDLAVAGMVNLNDDGLDIVTARRVYPKFEKQQINIEHSRKTIVGYIIKAGLSEIGTDRILTEEEAALLNGPFNIAVVIAIWRAVSKDLCEDLIKASNPSHSEYQSVSLSFEMAFGKKDFYICVLPADTKEIAKAVRIITPIDPDFEAYAKALRSYGGSGLAPDNSGNRVYRLMPPEVVPLGGGIVEVPAAAVKGLTVIDKAVNPTPVVITAEKECGSDEEEDDEDDENKEEQEKDEEENEDEDGEDVDESDDIAATNIRQNAYIIFDRYEKIAAARIILPKTCVSTSQLINNSNMNKAEIEALKEKATKVASVAEAQEVFASAVSIVDLILKESEERHQKALQSEALAAEQQKLKAEAIASAEAVKAELATLKTQLAEIQAAQAQAAAEAAFNDRMTLIDETFEFDDEEKAYVVAEVKDLDDETFAKWMEKSKKMMKEKTKAAKKAKGEMMKKKDDVCAALAAKGIKFDTEAFSIEEVIASALANPTSTPLHNQAPEAKGSLKELAKAAFADGMTIGGKKLTEINVKK